MVKSTVYKIGVAALAIVVVLAWGLHRRYQLLQDERAEASQAALQRVTITHPHFETSESRIDFPGQLEGYISASVYARVNGYLESWNTDIGAVVHTGDLMARIDSPETDAQYEQAKSDVLAAESAEKLADVTFKRWETLLKSDSVSRQEVDQKSAELDLKRAQRRIAESTLTRATKFLEYKNVRAPFNGIVSERNVDIGDLVSNGAGKRLFSVTNIDKLRLYIQLPQLYLNDIHPGLKARLNVPEYPGQTFDAVVVRSSGAVSNLTGTSLVEIEVDNKIHKLTAGEYANVSLPLHTEGKLLRMPSSALIARNTGTFVATVDAQSRVRFMAIIVARDLGQDMEVVGKLTESSQVIAAPSDTLTEGQEVVVQRQGEQASHNE